MIDGNGTIVLSGDDAMEELYKLSDELVAKKLHTGDVELCQCKHTTRSEPGRMLVILSQDELMRLITWWQPAGYEPLLDVAQIIVAVADGRATVEEAIARLNVVVSRAVLVALKGWVEVDDGEA